MKANFVATKMRYALCDAEGNPINNKIFEDIKQGNNYISFKSNGKWGLLDEDGNILHAAEFDDVKDTVGKYILVEKNNRYGILNPKAQVVVPIKYKKIDYAINSSKKIYWICNNDEHLNGVYDEQFNNILPEKYYVIKTYLGRIVFGSKDNVVFLNYEEDKIKGFGRDYGDDFEYKYHLTIKPKYNYNNIDIFLVGNDDDKDLQALYYNYNKEKIDMITIPNINIEKIKVIDIGVSILLEKKDDYFNIYTFCYIENKLVYFKVCFDTKIKNVLYNRYGNHLILRDEKNRWYIVEPENSFKIVNKFPNLPKFMRSYMFGKENIDINQYEYIKID